MRTVNSHVLCASVTLIVTVAATRRMIAHLRGVARTALAAIMWRTAASDKQSALSLYEDEWNEAWHHCTWLLWLMTARGVSTTAGQVCSRTRRPEQALRWSAVNPVHPSTAARHDRHPLPTDKPVPSHRIIPLEGMFYRTKSPRYGRAILPVIFTLCSNDLM